MRNRVVWTSEAVPKPPSCLHFVEAACPPCPDGPSLLVAKVVITTSGPTAHQEQHHRTQHSACVHTTTGSHAGLPTQATRASSERAPPGWPAPAAQHRGPPGTEKAAVTRQTARSRASSWQLSSVRSLTLSLSLSLSLPISKQSPSLTCSPSENQPASTFV